MKAIASHPEREPKYIALEGAEGTGKSTQAYRLAATLDAVITRETGGTPIGTRIRSILHDTSVDDLDPMSEAMLVRADRAQHIARVVRPALQAGRNVVSDRCWWSFIAYQAFGREQPTDDMFILTRMATGELFLPNLVIVLRATRKEIAERMESRELDRFEAEDADFFERVDEGYEYLLEKYPDNSCAIDTKGGVEATQEKIRQSVKERLEI